jgi:hypothetical protein
MRANLRLSTQREREFKIFHLTCGYYNYNLVRVASAILAGIGLEICELLRGPASHSSHPPATSTEADAVLYLMG